MSLRRNRCAKPEYATSRSRLDHVLSVGLRNKASIGVRLKQTDGKIQPDGRSKRQRREEEMAQEAENKRQRHLNELAEMRSRIRELTADEKALVISKLKTLLLNESVDQQDAKEIIENLCMTDKAFAAACSNDRTWSMMFAEYEEQERVYWEENPSNPHAQPGRWMVCAELIHKRNGYDLYDTRIPLRQRVMEFRDNVTSTRLWLPRHFVDRRAFETMGELEFAMASHSAMAESMNPEDDVNIEEVYGHPEAWILSELPEGSDFTMLFNTTLFEPEDYVNPPIGAWDMSRVSNTSGMLRNLTYFDQYIGRWNMSNVVNASEMFAYCREFNQDIGDWDTSNFEDTTDMFYDCKFFDQNIGKWNVNKVVNATNMFNGCGSFNQDLSSWRLSPDLWNMQGMFCGCTQFNKPLNDWEVEGVVAMDSMFKRSGYNQPLDRWNVSNVITARSMFKMSQFDQDIGNWNFANLVSARKMFAYSMFDKPLDGWKLPRLVYPEMMFSNSTFKQDLSMWSIKKSSDLPYPIFDPDYPERYKPYVREIEDAEADAEFQMAIQNALENLDAPTEDDLNRLVQSAMNYPGMTEHSDDEDEEWDDGSMPIAMIM